MWSVPLSVYPSSGVACHQPTGTRIIIPSDFSNSLVRLNPVLIEHVLIFDVTLDLAPLFGCNHSNNMLQYGVN